MKSSSPKNKDLKSSDTTNVRMGKIGNRPFWVLKLSIALRGIHLLGAAVFLSSYLLELKEIPPFYIYLTFSSGLILLYTEWLRHREIYREIAGFTTFIKLLLLGLALHGFSPTTITVTAAFLLATIGSHAPKEYRHRLLF